MIKGGTGKFCFLAKLAALFLLDPVIGGQIVLDRTLLWIIVSEHQPHFRYELHRNLCEKAMFFSIRANVMSSSIINIFLLFMKSISKSVTKIKDFRKFVLFDHTFFTYIIY